MGNLRALPKELVLEAVFDRNLVEARHRRARRGTVPGADFLLRHVSEDLVSRLAVVERRFTDAVVIDDPDGSVAADLETTGRIDNIRSVSIEAGEGGSEVLPLAPQSADLVVSPLGLHLVNDTPGIFVQIMRALRPDGLFLAAIPGSGTLQELRESLLAAETARSGGASPRVIPFAEVRDYGGLLQRTGFALPVTDVETLTVRYDTMFGLMFDLRAMGMTNPLADRSRKPATRGLFAQAAEIYGERFSDPDGRVRATFSTVYLSGWAPHASQQKPLRPGSAKARLADALGAVEKKASG